MREDVSEPCLVYYSSPGHQAALLGDGEEETAIDQMVKSKGVSPKPTANRENAN